MEATTNDSRKRGRDHEAETLQAKRQECPNPADENQYEFYDGISVFDFPWLKEGVIFNWEASFEDHQENFGPCSYLDEAGADLCQSCSLENVWVGKSKEGVDSFWSLLVDDEEAVDCIWSCVIDQPLDLGFNNDL